MITYKKIAFSVAFFLLSLSVNAQKSSIAGIVFESDSLTTLPFAYVVNKNTRLGVTTDANGHFKIEANDADTLLISYIGKLPEKIVLKKVANLSATGFILKVYLKNKPEELKQVTIRSIDFTKEQRAQYEKYIYKPLNNTPINSPITFMYDRFSKEAKSREKLRTFYEQDLLDEMARKRLTNQLIINLTGNPSMDFDKLKQICPLSSSFIVTALEYDLYLQVKKCYQAYLQNR